MLLEETVYVVETVSISGRTTAVVHAVANCYAPTIIQTYATPALPYSAKNSSLFTLCPETPINRAFQGVKSYQQLFTPRNADKHRGFQAKGEE